MHGDTLVGKPDNCMRFYFENVDGFVIPANQTKKTKLNNKQTYLRQLLLRLDSDFFGAVETRQQFDLLPHSQRLDQQLDLREGAKCQTSHNVHERFGTCQQGGTCIAANEMAGSYVSDQGADEEGLGRWSWVKLTGRTVTTRVVVAYIPCNTRKQAVQATMAQHRRYWRLQGEHRCPRRLMRLALVEKLKEWRSQGDKLILFIDGNEDMSTGPLARMLADEELAMIDAVRSKSNLPGPPTFARGRRQIDCAWVTPDINVGRACFLPFFFGVGDHRAIILDIPIHSLLGGDIHKIARPTARRLVCSSPEVREKYNEILELYCIQHRIQNKLYSLFPPTYPPSSTAANTMEVIDRVLGEGMSYAEKKCRKIRAGAVPFSDKLAKAGHQIKLWRLVVRHKVTNSVNTRTIRRVAKRCNLQSVLSVTLVVAKEKLAQAHSDYLQLKKIAHRLRYEFLCEREENAKSSKARKAIRMIRKHEEARRSWRSIHHSHGKARCQGVSSVQVQEDDDLTTLSEQEAVEEAIARNNSKRFHLTKSTPLMSEYMQSKLGFLASKEIANNIRSGNFVPDPNLDTYTNCFLSFVSNRSQLPQISASVLTKDFIGYWKGARERTSSSLSGRHFGHYKAAAYNIQLAEIHASLTHIASHSSICLSRWCRGLTVMLEKEAGNTRVDKLRAILLMEADFNFLNKLLFGHRLVQQIEAHHRFPDELYGSRASLSAISVAINRRLTIDIFKQKRRTGTIAGVDAAQCYDRIVHSLAILLCQREGAPLSSLLMMFGVIQAMTFYLRTTFGDSSLSYGGLQPTPFQGSCQGNGASPAMWLIISLYLVLLMKEQGHVSTVTSPLSGITLIFIGFLFVDDTDLVVLGKDNENEVQVHNRLQSAINFWNGFLRVSGGSLKPEKCYWYFTRFRWNDGVWSLAVDEPPPIFITADNGTPTAIMHKLPSEATKAVGVWQDITGSSTKQVEELINKIRSTHQSMDRFPVPRHLVWLGMKQSIWKSIEYVLPATTMSAKDAALVAKELYRPLLPKLGCNRNFPIALRYNPPWLLGLGLHDPFIEQGLSKLQQFLLYGNSTTISGKLLTTSLEHLQLEVGSFTSIFALDYSTYSIFTSPTWLTCLWEFLCEHDIVLSSYTFTKPRPLRLHDEALMDIFISQHSLPTKTLQSINRVRCHLKVFSLADIATGDGMRICHKYLHGVKDDTDSIWEWPMEQPSQKDYGAWKSAMKLLLDERQFLHNPLGNWLAKPHLQWKWFYSPAEDTVYKAHNNTYTSFTRSRSSTRTNQVFIHSNPQTAPSDILTYTTVMNISDNVVRFEGTDSSDITSIPPCIAPVGDPFWILDSSNVLQRYNEPWITNGLQNGSLLAVCDGSYKPKLCANGVSAAFIIESQHGQSTLWGNVATSGISADPYRGELLGIYATLSAISFIERHNHSFTHGKINIGCDNEMAGWIAGGISPTAPSRSKHIDLIKAIKCLRASLCTVTSFYHIYGHQDNHTSFHTLPRDAQLNVLVDSAAQTAFELAHEHSSFKQNAKFFHEGWTVEIGGVKLHDKFSSHVRHWIAKRKLRHYLYQKDLIGWNTFPNIDFEPLQLYLSSQSQAFQLWFTKHWTGFCGIGIKMKQMKLWDNDLCPCCRQVPETKSMHIFLCPHPSMVKLRNTSFQNILTWLTDIDTDPLIIEIISTFWYGQEMDFDHDTPPIMLTMYNILREIGVHQMWTGLLPIHLIDIQQQYYNYIGSRRSARQWGSTLVGKMLRATHGLWMERNRILHLRTASGVHGLQMICLDRAISAQYDLGYENLNQEDYHLIEREKQDLLQQPVDVLRGWLCEILIARGDFAAARLESLQDRGESTYSLPTLTATEMQKYCDWRQVCLTQRFSVND